MSFLKSPKIIKFLKFGFVPLLLIVIAIRQIILVDRIDLTPWKGGGFGMFSSIDRPSNRVIEVVGITKEGNPIQIDLTFSDNVISEREQLLIKTVPRTKLLEQTARKILDSELHQTTIEGVYYLTEKDSRKKEISTKKLALVTIRIWNLNYDRHKNTVWYEPLSQKIEVKQKY